MENNIIFGPISSRRFGVSLGVDLSPVVKQCNFDCLYCELSPAKTVDAQSKSIDVSQIITEIKKHLNTTIDVITFTANGEPTLYPYLDKLIDEVDNIKGNTQTLILTNSATLTDEKVFNSLLKLDQVKLSLDAISEDIFKKLDRPHKSVNIKKIADKIIEFSKIYKGKLYIEILFVRGLNDKQAEIQKLNNTLLHVKATRIDLGTIDRPPAYPVDALSYKELHTLSMMFDSKLPIHIASRTQHKPTPTSYTDEEILNTLEMRPLTYDDIDLLFDNESKKRLQNLIKNSKITEKQVTNLIFLIPYSNLKRNH